MPFQCLSFLQENGVKFIYTHFAQRAMVEQFDSNWNGSCDALSHDWLYRKLCNKNIHEVTTYEITEPDLPHVVITGENVERSQDIGRINFIVNNAFHNQESRTSQQCIDIPSGLGKLQDTTKKQSIKNLLKIIESGKHCCGIIEAKLSINKLISSSKLFFSKQKNEAGRLGHALAFVKRGDAISFYDPNNGEITFDKFSDFRIWFKNEITTGTLKYLINDPKKPSNHAQVGSSHSHDITFNQKNFEQKMEHYSVDKRLQKRIKDTQIKRAEANKKIQIVKSEQYLITYWSGDKYIEPTNLEKYYGLHCDVILMSSPPQEDNVKLKRHLLPENKQAYVIVDAECFFVKKQGTNIAINKLNMDTLSDLEAVMEILNPSNYKLKDGETFKIINKSPLSLNDLYSMGKRTDNTIAHTDDADVSDTKDKSKEKRRDSKIGIFAQKQDVKIDDEYFEKAYQFLDSLNHLTGMINNNHVDSICAQIDIVLENAQNQYLSNTSDINDSKTECHQTIVNILSAVSNKLLETYMDKVECFINQARQNVIKRQ